MTEKDIFSAENIPAAKTGNFYKFINVGDYIMGTFLGTKYNSGGHPGFAPQMLYRVVKAKTNGTLQDEETEFFIPVKETNTYVNSRLARAKYGDIIGLKLDALIPPKEKGKQPAKSYIPVIIGPDTEFLKTNTQPQPDIQEDAVDVFATEVDVKDMPY